MTQLHAQWITGFVDGEGCFNLDIHLKKDMTWGLQMQPEFTVVQNEIDEAILHALKAFFKCGSIGKNRSDESGTRLHFRVKNVEDLHTKVIPFFEKHSLKTKKKVEFLRFRTIVSLMNAGYHRESLENFLDIVDQGANLRVRRKPKSGNRSTKVEKVVKELRELSKQLAEQEEQNPTQKDIQNFKEKINDLYPKSKLRKTSVLN